MHPSNKQNVAKVQENRTDSKTKLTDNVYHKNIGRHKRSFNGQNLHKQSTLYPQKQPQLIYYRNGLCYKRSMDEKNDEIAQLQHQENLRDVQFLQTSQYKDTMHAAKRTSRKNAGLSNDLYKKTIYLSCEYRATVRFINAYSRKLKDELVSIREINKKGWRMYR